MIVCSGSANQIEAFALEYSRILLKTNRTEIVGNITHNETYFFPWSG